MTRGFFPYTTTSSMSDIIFSFFKRRVKNYAVIQIFIRRCSGADIAPILPGLINSAEFHPLYVRAVSATGWRSANSETSTVYSQSSSQQKDCIILTAEYSFIYSSGMPPFSAANSRISSCIIRMGILVCRLILLRNSLYCSGLCRE